MRKLIAVIGLAAAVASPLALADTAQLDLAPGASGAEKKPYTQNQTRTDAQRQNNNSFWYESTGGVPGY